MRSVSLLSLLMFLFSAGALSQTLTDSNLPIVIITTDGGEEIPDDPKINASMQIIWRGPGERNYLSDRNNPLFLNYNGRIGIEIRGSSSQESPKKSYGFTTRKSDDVSNNNVSLLGMPKENDWILGGMVFDTAFVRDYIGHSLYGQMGNYASRAAYCEVIINDVYQGLYILQEKLKADPARINVIKIGKDDNTLPELSGGYITKADKRDWDEPLAWMMYSFEDQPVEYIHSLPKPKNATPEQTAYLRDIFFSLEAAARNGDASPATGFPAIIDIPSFIDYMLLNEFTSNPDAYQYSTFFHKERNGKLRAGPVWDLDLTFGNDLFQWGYDRSKTDLWYFEDEWANNGSTFWRDLFHNNQFRCYLSRRWHELIAPGMPLNRTVREAFLDETVSLIAEAAARDCARWNKATNQPERIAAIKSFMQARQNWITAHIGSYGTCSNVAVPPLKVTMIMYHPDTTPLFPDNKSTEFIEVTNAGTMRTDLTGVCFMGTGPVYRFPAGTVLDPGRSLFLASNAEIFEARYGFSPFGQFTRNLSDSGEAIILGDAFGNLINRVEYSAGEPWPDASGNGSYLRLRGLSLDNSLPGSWEATSEAITTSITPVSTQEPALYPNPCRERLTLRAESDISSICLYDMRGTIVMTREGYGPEAEIDMGMVPPGVYIIRIFTRLGSYARTVTRL